MRVQNMFLYIREYTLKSKEAVKPLGLRNNSTEMQRLENGRFHTHTHTHTHARTHTHTHTHTNIYAHVQQQKKTEGAVYFPNCNAFKNECVYIYIYMYV